MKIGTHDPCVPLCKKPWNRFLQFCFQNFWPFLLKMLHQLQSSLGQQASS